MSSSLFRYLNLQLCPHNSQKKADYKKERCGNLLLYPTDRLLAFAFGTDKTIAHTKGYVKSQLWLYTPMMWYYCYHLRSISNFARICQLKIISITPFSIRSFLTPPLWRRNSGVKVILFSDTAKTKRVFVA